MAKVEQVVNVNSVSRISAGTFFKGDITSLSDIRIDGDFEGRLYSKGRVVVGETADVRGDIICDNMDMLGHLSGNVYVKDTFSFKKGCSVAGTINIRKLAVELGSVFNGTCKMITEAEFDEFVKKSDFAKVNIEKKAQPQKVEERK